MSAALMIVYACLVTVEAAVMVAWILAIGGVTSFLDTLGIGNYAQITALLKLRGPLKIRREGNSTLADHYTLGCNIRHGTADGRFERHFAPNSARDC